MTQVIIHGNNDFQNGKSETGRGGFNKVKSRSKTKEDIKYNTIKSLKSIRETKQTLGFFDRWTTWTVLWVISGFTVLPVIGVVIGLWTLRPKEIDEVKFECALDDGRTLLASMDRSAFEVLQNEMYALHGNIEGAN